MQRITRSALILGGALSLFGCKKEVENKPNTVDPKTDSAVMQNDSTAVSENPTDVKISYKKFSGAWFDIEYPSTFTAENSLKSYTNSEDFDSAVFTSPDGKVQFYVFSPQWSGEPTDIKIKPGEKIIETNEELQNGPLVKRWTVEANDGSYSRSYEETSETQSNINKVFGIKYASKADRDKYQKEYLHFKNSLVQYAD